MKKYILTLVVGLLCCLTGIHAQTFSSTCSTPMSVNSSSSYTFSTQTSTPNLDVSNDYGCITPANNAQWFYFQACTSGPTSFIFTSSLTSGSDINCIIWGPLSAPTDCGLTAGQILDCSNYSSVGSPMDTLSFSVTAGSYYKMLVSNYSNALGSYSFSATSASVILSDSCPSCAGMPMIQPICQVTTDPVLNKNVIIWEKDTTYTGNYVVQKESTTMGIYTTLQTVPNNDTSVYIDSVSNPMIQAFLYRIATTDTCGNVFPGPPHKTIHLLTSISSSTGYPQLAWNSYSGFSYGTFFIYRGASPSTLSLYDSISASMNSYTDVAAVPGMNYYAIAVFPAMPCQPSRSMAQPSMSNCSPVMFTGVNEYEFNGLTVGPNPANNTLNFLLGTVSADISIQLIDVTGRIVMAKEFRNVTSDMIDLSEIANGSYVVRFSSENQTTHRNIIVAR